MTKAMKPYFLRFFRTDATSQGWKVGVTIQICAYYFYFDHMAIKSASTDIFFESVKEGNYGIHLQMPKYSVK